MTTLWLIRHGETDWNVTGRLQGQLEVPLNAHGRRQAKQLAVRLGKEHAAASFAALFTSDLGRAQETAAEASAVLGMPATPLVALRERNFGVLSEFTLPEAAVKHPELFARLRARDVDFVPEGGESLAQTSARALRVLRQLAQQWPGTHVLVVTHGGVIDAAWRAAQKQPLSVRREHELLNASINRVTVEQEQFALAGWGDVAHLDPGG